MLARPEGRSRNLSCCAGAASLALVLGACSSDEGAAFGNTRECAVLEAGELATMDADAHVLGSVDALGGAAGSLARALLPDGDDVYWYDAHGSVFVEHQGDGQVVELRPGEPPSETQHEVGLGLAANADRLFVGYGHRPNEAIDLFPLEYDPPGRLLSISKQDGQSALLLEVADRWLVPITADAERVIVFAAGSGTDGLGFYQVPLASPRLEPLPFVRITSPSSDSSAINAALAPLSGGHLMRGQVYWVNPGFPRQLLRAGFDDTEPEVLMEVADDYSFSVGPGYIMTQEYVASPDYHYARDFVVRDDAGCRSVRGPRGDTVTGTALDANQAYWSGGAADGLEPAATELTRIDLQNGALTRMNTPGFTPVSYLWLVGHDETRLFLYSDGVLASVRKP